LLAGSSASLKACTLWAAAGEDASGGTIISKNRDWKPDHTQVLKMHRDRKVYGLLWPFTPRAMMNRVSRRGSMNVA